MVKRGYYAADLEFKNGTKVNNTKVLSLNTNYCYMFNFESMVTFKDPAYQLEWLIKELDNLEKVNGAAILLGHLPNIDECNRQFGLRLHAIMDRY